MSEPTNTSDQAQPVTATLEQMAQAFEAWENGFRADPAQFMSADECAKAAVTELSASRAAYFYELLNVRA